MIVTNEYLMSEEDEPKENKKEEKQIWVQQTK